MAEPNMTCAICLGKLGTNGGVVTLHCGHPFCRTCATRHHEYSRHRGVDHRCPVCRTVQLGTLDANNDSATVERTPAHHDGSRHQTENVDRFASTSHLAEHLGTRPGISALSDVHAVRHSHTTRDRTSTSSTAALVEAQNNVQFLMAGIMSIQDRPLIWDIQHLELQRTDRQLSDAGHNGAPDLVQFISQVQDCTARLTADFAEFVGHFEGQRHRHPQQNRRPQLQRDQFQLRPNSNLGSVNPLVDVLRLFEQLLHET
ncbi:TPA: zinc ion binding [Trebouxia sp. C0004]